MWEIICWELIPNSLSYEPNVGIGTNLARIRRITKNCTLRFLSRHSEAGTRLYLVSDILVLNDDAAFRRVGAA